MEEEERRDGRDQKMVRYEVNTTYSEKEMNGRGNGVMRQRDLEGGKEGRVEEKIKHAAVGE